MWSKMVGDFSF